jgi:cytochrome P450/NADPH-cytochrome P450 reductase
MDGAFQDWSDALWPELVKTFGIKAGADTPAEAEPLYTLEELPPPQKNALVDALGAVALRVIENRELQNPGSDTESGRSTRHVELTLPEGVNYVPGDHLSVVPRNSPAQVERAMARFGFDRSAHVRLSAVPGRKAALPVDQVIAVDRLLGDYVELQDVATRKQIATLAAHTECPFTKPKLLALSGSDEASQAAYKAEVLHKRKSLLELLEEHRACQVPFAVFLEMLSPLSPRYYSISSSPAMTPGRCSVTVGVVSAPALSGSGTFEGVCSNYLARAEAGDTVHGVIRETTAEGFRLPEDAARPLIMIGPGTGLAPFRGFLQERAAQVERGEALGEAMLFFGCRHPEQDFIYAEELKAWSHRGLMKLHTAFSRSGERKVYVQDLIREQAAAVWKLLEAGCGGVRVRRRFAHGARCAAHADRHRARARARQHRVDGQDDCRPALRAGRLGGHLNCARRRSMDPWPAP